MSRKQAPVVTEPVDFARYAGKFVAWDLNRSRILASGNNDLEVLQGLQSRGIPIEQAIFSYVPYDDEVIIGGATGGSD
jgi:hypothetical protein